MLRDSMRELGLDQAIKDAATRAIPDARDRLRYGAQMTEQAANRMLNATEQAGPVQDGMSRSAQALDTRWATWYDQPLELPKPANWSRTRARSWRMCPSRRRPAVRADVNSSGAQDFQ